MARLRSCRSAASYGNVVGYCDRMFGPSLPPSFYKSVRSFNISRIVNISKAMGAMWTRSVFDLSPAISLNITGRAGARDRDRDREDERQTTNNGRGERMRGLGPAPGNQPPTTPMLTPARIRGPACRVGIRVTQALHIIGAPCGVLDHQNDFSRVTAIRSRFTDLHEATAHRCPRDRHDSRPLAGSP